MKIFGRNVSKNNYLRIAILLLLLFSSYVIFFQEKSRLSAPQKILYSQKNHCISLLPDPGPYKEAEIKRSGKYCVNDDFWQERLSDLAGHSGPGSHRHLIDVATSNVEIDILNHTLHSDGHSSGIVLGQDYQNATDTDSATVRNLPMAKNVTIKNGVLDFRGLGNGVVQFNQWRMYSIDESVPKDFQKYEITNVTLENLLIKTDNVGIILEGEGNTIRNCIIESGGIAAITMAGPNSKIINNRIVLTDPFIPGEMRGTKLRQFRDFSALLESRREAKAAIALHQATGSIISGNQIEVKGKSLSRHSIYLADASADVRIEENTFVGAENPVTLAGNSTAIIINNKLEPRRPWWQF